MPPRIFAIILLLAAFAPRARGATGPGSSTGEFLAIGAGARPAGLAGAFSGLADDVHALAYNPAGLAFLSRRELALDHDAFAPGISHEWAGYAHPATWGTLAGSANLVFTAPFESYDAFDQPSGKTSAADAAYQFAFATAVTRDLALGVAAKHVTSRLHRNSATAFAGDAGLLWRAASNLRLGASLLNFGQGLRYIAATSDLPTTARVGAAWTPFDPRDFRHSLTVLVEGEKRRDEGARIAGGLEGSYDNVLALRAGARSQPNEGLGLTLGLGIFLFRDETKGFELDFDYAFAAAGDFGSSHRAGLTLKFGEPLPSASRAAILQKSAMYYDDARPKTSRPRRTTAPPPSKPSPRPSKKALRSAEPTISPDDTNWIKP